MVADQRLQPTFTADLAAAMVAAVEAGAGGRPAPDRRGRLLLARVHRGDHGAAGIDVPIEPVQTTIPPGGAARPLNGVLARPRADALGLPRCAPGRGARRLHGAGQCWPRPSDNQPPGADGAAGDKTRGPDADRAEGVRRRARLLLPRPTGRASSPSSGSPRRWCRTTTPAPTTASSAACTSRSATGAAKLVRCGRGAIFDVVVDLRRGSPTFGQWEGFELTEENMHIAYCPIGFAHGFCVLSDVADVMYKQSNYYSDETERGISYRDPDVGIEWPLPVEELKPSERDTNGPDARRRRRRAPLRVLRLAGALRRPFPPGRRSAPRSPAMRSPRARARCGRAARARCARRRSRRRARRRGRPPGRGRRRRRASKSARRSSGT